MTIDPAVLETSLAEHLHALGVGHYQPAGAYPPDLMVPAITVGKLPQSIPSAIAITYYLTESNPDLVLTTPLHMVQLLFREPDRRTVIDREHTLRRVLHTMLPGSWPGGITPLSVAFSHAAPADPDEGHQAWTKAANYAIRLNPGE